MMLSKTSKEYRQGVKRIIAKEEQEVKRLIHEYLYEPIIHWPEGFTIQQVEKFYMGLRKAKQHALAQMYLDKKASTFSKLIMKSLDKWENKKKEELRIRRNKLLKEAKEIESISAEDYNPEEDPLVQKVKVILASKMIQLKRLLKKHPFVSKYIDRQLDAINKFIEQGDYKSAIMFVNNLIVQVEGKIADEEGKVAMLELTKAEGEAREKVIANMDTLVERLNMEESVLLGKGEYFDDLIVEHDTIDYFKEDTMARDTYREKKKWYRKLRQKYPKGEEEASKRCITFKEAKEKVQEYLSKKDYEGATKYLEVCGKRVIAYGSIKRQKAPKKFKQIGISKPIIDSEDRTILTTYPIEYEDQVKAREEKEKEKEKAKQEKEFDSLKEAFRDYSPEEKSKLIQNLLKRKQSKMGGK